MVLLTGAYEMFPYGFICGLFDAFVANVPVREYLLDFRPETDRMFPYGNIMEAGLKYTPEQIGSIIRDTRKRLGVTQKDLALTSGTGLRFVIDLEKGKETCELGKSLRILQTLGITLTLTPPAGEK